MANFHQFDHESTETFEVGFKSDLLDNTVRLNAAVFFTDYTDLQFVFRAGPAPYLLNAGKAQINGFEADLTWVPTENWIIEAGIGYIMFTNDMKIPPRLDIAYRDETYFDTGNTVEIAQLDKVVTVDGSLSIRPDNGDWSVILGVNNLTNELYPVAGNSSLTTGTGYGEIAYARPREWFATFRMIFKQAFKFELFSSQCLSVYCPHRNTVQRSETPA